MKTLIISLILIFAINQVSSQIIESVYKKSENNDTLIRELKYTNSTIKTVFKVNKDNKGVINIPLTLNFKIPFSWYPVTKTGINTPLNEDTIACQHIFYSHPFKHKIFDDFIFFSPLFELAKKQSDKTLEYIPEISSSLFYLTKPIVDRDIRKIDPRISIGYQLTKKKTDFLKPFYFKKAEVTNKEYREFTNWVRDSIAMELLFKEGYKEFKTRNGNGNYDINWNKRDEIWQSDDPEKQEILQELYLANKERFYKRKEIDKGKLLFNGLKIYPDTLVWIRDYYTLNENSKHYYYHNAFDYYPVVGVSWNQAKAFCKWKTMMLQEEIDKARLPFKIEVDLPQEHEREYVISKYNPMVEQQDKSILNTLHVDLNYQKWELGEGILWTKSGNYGKNGFFFTHPVDLTKRDSKKRTDGTNFTDKEREHLFADLSKEGISGLKSNVSEWMNENFQKNWLPALEMRHKIYHSINPDEYEKNFLKLDSASISKREYYLLKTSINSLMNFYKVVLPIHYQLETEFNKHINNDGKLIRGSNWFDETFERKNLINAKTFASPDKSFATVGFRYVIHVYPKE